MCTLVQPISLLNAFHGQPLAIGVCLPASSLPAQYASWAADASWAVASSAVLLAIPIVVELQRETTVRVMQHQREMETQQIQVCSSRCLSRLMLHQWLPSLNRPGLCS